MGVKIRMAKNHDYQGIADVYNYYVLNTIVSFDEEEFSAEGIKRKYNSSGIWPWAVAENDGQIIGFAYAAPFRARSAYRNTLEVSIYLSPQYSGQGIGKKLYNRLIKECAAKGAHSLIAVIAIPNEASIRLHESVGFNFAGHLHEVGVKFGQLLDIVFYEKIVSR